MPSNTFVAFDLHPQILANVVNLGYTAPTPIQQKSIPSVMEGHDLMGLAQTGTGKTAAFLLPVLHRLHPGPRGHVRALILAPTRELAQQIHEAFGSFAKELKLRSVVLYGGMSISPQKEKLRRGAEVVIACPGRLLDHVRQRSVNLSKVEVLVLDEADHMFDVGFLPDVRQILQQLPAKRQSLLFSATMPAEVRQLANDILKNPVQAQISNTSSAKTITQALYPVSQNLKTDLLIKLLQTLQIHSALVFTRTKHRAKRVSEQLEAAGYTATSLQGNLSQSKRRSALNNFKIGKLQILVATDIASRGIDIASISHVFNYDMPDTVEAYTHRIGRTGRAAKLGDAFTLLAREDLPKLYRLERTLNIKIEQRTVADFDYKAAGQSGSMRDDSVERTPRRGFSDDRTSRPASRGRRPEFSQGDRTGSYRGKAKSASFSPRGNDDRSTGTGYSRSRPPAAEGYQNDRPATNRHRDAPYRQNNEKPATRVSYRNAADGNTMRPAAAPNKPRGAFNDRAPSDRGDRPMRRHSSPSTFGEPRSEGYRGDRPPNRNRGQGAASDRPSTERPAGRGGRPFKPTFKPGTKKPGPKPHFSAKKPRRPE